MNVIRLLVTIGLGIIIGLLIGALTSCYIGEKDPYYQLIGTQCSTENMLTMVEYEEFYYCAICLPMDDGTLIWYEDFYCEAWREKNEDEY